MSEVKDESVKSRYLARHPEAGIYAGFGDFGFWRLEVAIPVNGDLQLAEDAKRYNQQLELIFGGDNCHNIDRIMRLPGTINVPEAVANVEQWLKDRNRECRRTQRRIAA